MEVRPESTPRPRQRSRLLRVVGVILLMSSIVVGVVLLVRGGSAVGGSFTEAMTAPAHQTPYEGTMALEPGEYTVYELVGSSTGSGGVEVREFEAPRVTTDDIVVTDAAGATLAITSLRPGVSESVSRGRDHYTAVAHFDVSKAGDYEVAVATQEARQVLVAPSLASGFKQLGRGFWLALFLTALAAMTGLALFIMSFIVGRRPASAPAVVPTIHTPTPAAGWYPDPHDARLQRYWNGQSWTAHTQPRQ